MTLASASEWSQKRSHLIEAKAHRSLLKFNIISPAQADYDSMRATLHFLRLCLRSRCRPLSVHLRIPDATGIQQKRQSHVGSVRNGISQEQLDKLNGLGKEAYPRILVSKSGISCQDFVNQYEQLERGETVESKYFTVRGMFVCLKPAGLGLCL